MLERERSREGGREGEEVIRNNFAEESVSSFFQRALPPPADRPIGARYAGTEASCVATSSERGVSFLSSGTWEGRGSLGFGLRKNIPSTKWASGG